MAGHQTCIQTITKFSYSYKRFHCHIMLYEARLLQFTLNSRHQNKGKEKENKYF